MLDSRIDLSVLILLNVVVLAGQLWPAGAPPFARYVNIAFLVASLAYFLAAFGRGRRELSRAASTPARSQDA